MRVRNRRSAGHGMVLKIRTELYQKQAPLLTAWSELPRRPGIHFERALLLCRSPQRRRTSYCFFSRPGHFSPAAGAKRRSSNDIGEWGERWGAWGLIREPTGSSNGDPQVESYQLKP